MFSVFSFFENCMNCMNLSKISIVFLLECVYPKTLRCSWWIKCYMIYMSTSTKLSSLGLKITIGQSWLAVDVQYLPQVHLWSTFYITWVFHFNTSAGKEELLIQLMAVWMDCDLSSALPVLGLVPAQPGRLTTNEAWSLRGAAAADTRVPLKPSVIASLWTLYDLPLCSGRLVGCVHSGISIFTLKRQDLLFFLS